MSAYILQFDAKHFYPGTWDKMTREEKEERQAQLHAIQALGRGNAGVTPGQQDFLQSTPPGGNAGNTNTEKTTKHQKTR